MEKWARIDEFPGYSVSTHGRVSNDERKQILTPSLNGRGIPTVGMTYEQRQYRRSIPVLVAEAWIANEYGNHFDTPTHLNGDRLDCHVDNLVWRPRWFAIEFHKTITVDQFPNWNPDYPFELVNTHEVFVKPLPCAMKYGLLQLDIVLGLVNKRPVFPGGLEFRQIR